MRFKFSLRRFLHVLLDVLSYIRCLCSVHQPVHRAVYVDSVTVYLLFTSLEITYTFASSLFRQGFDVEIFRYVCLALVPRFT